MATNANNPFSFDFSKLTNAFKNKGPHGEAMMENYRRHMETVTAAQRQTIETLKSITELHTQYARTALEDCAQHVKNVAAAKTLEEKMKIHTDGVKAGTEKAVAHGKTVMGHLSKAHKETTAGLKDAATETVQTVKAAYTKAATTPKK